MSEARQCDRCNKFYSINDIKEKRGEYLTHNKTPVHSMTLYDSNNNRIKHLDLCPECSRSLIVWLNDWGQYEDAENENENDINHINCPYRKDVVCTPNNDGNYNCIMCDVYKQIFGKKSSFVVCPYLKNDTNGLACVHTETCKGPCELVLTINEENEKEDGECSTEENTSSI